MTNVEDGRCALSSTLAVAGEVATYAIVAWLAYNLSVIVIYVGAFPEIASRIILFGAPFLLFIGMLLRYAQTGYIVARRGDWIDPIKVIIGITLWTFTFANDGSLPFAPTGSESQIVIVADFAEPDPENGALVVGFYNDLLDFLPTVAPGLRIVGSAPDVIGPNQRVTILEASGDQDDTGFSIRLAIRNSSADNVFWTRDYRTSKLPSEILKLRSSVTRDISNLLGGGYDQEEYERSIASADGTSIVPAAYEAFLSALAMSRLHDSIEPDQIANIIELLEQAVQIDPDFGAAWARLANAYVSRGWFGYVIHDHEKTDKILERLDTLLGSDHFVTLRTRGIVLYQRDRDLNGGRAALLSAHRINPRDVTTNAYLGYIERRLGLSDSAINRHEFVISVDPLFVPVATILPHLYDSQEYWEKLENFLETGIRTSITDKRDVDLVLSQMLDQNTTDRRLFRRIAERYGALGDRIVTHHYWFENEPTLEHIAFLGRLRDITFEQLENMRATDEDVLSGQLRVKRILLARAASYKSIGDLSHYTADMDQLETLGILEPPNYSVRSGPRQHAQTVIFHALQGNILAAAREMEIVENWTDRMEDRLAARQVYSDLACAAVLARDADALVRLIEKGSNTPREFSLVAIAMTVPGFQYIENDSRLTHHIQKMQEDADRLQAIILPYLEGPL